MRPLRRPSTSRSFTPAAFHPSHGACDDSCVARASIRRLALRVLAALGAIVALLALFALVDGWTAFGTTATGERRARMERSPQWKDGRFVNPQPLVNHYWDMVDGALHVSEAASPQAPLTPAPTDPRTFDAPPASGLRVTWFGHSSILIEIDGRRVLADANWSTRTGPLSWIGPTRWYPPTLALAELPPIDAVLVSHDHYDHLDRATVLQLAATTTATFVVPLGVGAHLEYWGVAPARITELDWWESTTVAGLRVTATPARHASGRLFAQDGTLWAGYALTGEAHRAFYSGDTGLFPAMAEIGEKLGPFDVTLIEVGQYHRAWPDWHIGPEQAVRAHQLLRGKVLFPVHWGLLTLAYHGWTEPAERVLAEAQRVGAAVVLPPPGVSVEPASAAAATLARWWPEAPWETGAQAPVVSTQMD